MPPLLLRDEPWFVQAFDRTWLRLYSHRGEEEAEAKAGHIVELLALRPNDRVLDVACGAGRYARALQKRGMRVTGIDLSDDLLDVARERAAILPGKPDYLRWDARQLPFAKQFEGAISMFTSVGYFDDAEHDLAIFRGVHRSLLPGRRFLIDFLNEARVRATLVPHEVSEEGTLTIEVRRRIEDTASGPTVFKHVEARDRGSGRIETTFEERVRLYTADELGALLTRAGLSQVGDPLGDVDGTPFGPDAPRLVLVAEKR